MNDAAARYVFVGGLHRSGTSLVSRSLGAHPEIARMADTGAIQDEGQFLQDVYPPARAHGGVGRFAFHEASHLTETSPLVSPESARRLEAAWARHWDKPTASLRVEKSPPNMLKMRFLQALWPDASFLLVIRHPVAVTAATMGMLRRRGGRSRWRSTRRTLHHWERANAIALRDAEHVTRFRLVRYEDFVACPQAVLRDLFGWLGVRDEPVAVETDPRVNDRYLHAWRGPDTWREFAVAARCGYLDEG